MTSKELLKELHENKKINGDLFIAKILHRMIEIEELIQEKFDDLEYRKVERDDLGE